MTKVSSDTLRLIRAALGDRAIAPFSDFTKAVRDVCKELERFRSERSYIIGHNDGWRDALRHEVFKETVDTDTPLEAAAREAGWALMELVDEIDFRKREHVSDIFHRLGTVLVSSPAKSSLCRYAMVFDGEDGWTMLPDHAGEYVKFDDVANTSKGCAE